MVVRIFFKLTFVYSGICLFKIYIYILYHKTCPNDQASFQVWQVELDEATMVNDIWTLKNSGPHGSWNRVAKKRPETKYLHRIKETFRFPKGLDVGHVECYTSFFVCRHVDVIHEYILIWIYIYMYKSTQKNRPWFNYQGITEVTCPFLPMGLQSQAPGSSTHDDLKVGWRINW